jgi:hypothetical protein
MRPTGWISLRSIVSRVCQQAYRPSPLSLGSNLCFGLLFGPEGTATVPYLRRLPGLTPIAPDLVGNGMRENGNLPQVLGTKVEPRTSQRPWSGQISLLIRSCSSSNLEHAATPLDGLEPTCCPLEDSALAAHRGASLSSRGRDAEPGPVRVRAEWVSPSWCPAPYPRRRPRANASGPLRTSRID